MAKAKSISNTTKKRVLITALEKTLGVVTQACQIANVARSTFYKWYQEDEAFKAKVDDMENIALDFVESKLHKQIEDGTPSSTIFYLKTKGKKRGYVERVEHDLTSKGEKIYLTPDEQIEKLKVLADKIEQAKLDREEHEGK